MSTKIVVFGSGRGSNFQSLYERSKKDKLDVVFIVFFSNKKDSGIMDFALQNSLNTFFINQSSFENSEKYEQRLLEELLDLSPDYILLAGYIKKIPDCIIDNFEYKIINIHPSLLPLFGGKGMYGEHVHNAVYESGMKITGATVHFVSKVYDEGPIINQSVVMLTGKESVQEIAQLVLKTEHELYYTTFKHIIEKKIKIINNKVIINEMS